MFVAPKFNLVTSLAAGNRYNVIGLITKILF
jgi:hypothetical protein